MEQNITPGQAPVRHQEDTRGLGGLARRCGCGEWFFGSPTEQRLDLQDHIANHTGQTLPVLTGFLAS